MTPRSVPVWPVIITPVMVGMFEVVRHSLLQWVLPSMVGNLLTAGLVGIMFAAYLWVVARHISKTERRLSKAREEAAVFEVRDRIARELHDGVSQALFYLGVRLRDLQEQLGTGETERAGCLVEELRANLSATDLRVKQAIAELRTRPVPTRLDTALRALKTSEERRLDLKLDLDEFDVDFTVPEKVLEHVLGVVREALENVAHHSGTNRARLSVRVANDAIHVSVTDSGCGFQTADVGSGFGLTTAQERAELLGGTLRIQSRPGGGTVVELAVPLAVVSQ